MYDIYVFVYSTPCLQTVVGVVKGINPMIFCGANMCNIYVFVYSAPCPQTVVGVVKGMTPII